MRRAERLSNDYASENDWRLWEVNDYGWRHETV
nr:MAG TPA: hypothetical protein [Caudoviricetes sp.]